MGTQNSGKLIFTVVLLGAVLLVSAASAQMQGFHTSTVAPRGVPASVTSFGFGGHPGFHGVPASVTSQGFGVSQPIRVVPGGINTAGFGVHHRPFGFDHHRRFATPFFYGGYYAPYAYPVYMQDNYASDDTVSNEIQAQRDYDAHQQLLNDYRNELNDYRAELNAKREQSAQTESAQQAVAEQPSTVLIFKDGHQDEVANYAIVGATLYELNDGRSKKVQLADLDLPATVKENDDRGIEFQVPAQGSVN